MTEQPADDDEVLVDDTVGDRVPATHLTIEDAFDDIITEVERDPAIDWNQLLRQRYPQFADELEPLLPAMVALCRQGAKEHSNTTGVFSSEGQSTSGELAANIPNMMGDYRIVGEVGRGGMGVVYEAIQVSLERRVALKVLPFASLVDPLHRVRFSNEARAAASVNHPNIVPVFATGEERGVHYLVMQFIRGQALNEIIRSLRRGATRTVGESEANASSPQDTPSRQWSSLRSSNIREFFTRVADIGAQLAEALAHAHRCGVIHRDIKPSNILIDCDGKPWLTDFGLAQLSNESRITRTGDLLGTMRYMSPEQAGGSKTPLDHRTDIYSLGATLYELVALRAAQDSGDKAKLLTEVQNREPVSLRSLCPDVPTPLATIIHKAMQKDASLRFDSAQEFSEDLCRFVDGEQIHARPPTYAQRFAWWARRNGLTLAVATFSALVLLGAGYHFERQHAKSLSAANRKLDRQFRRSKEDLATALRAMDRIVLPIVFEHENLEDMTAQQRLAVDDSINLYLDIAHRHRRDPGFMKEASMAYLNIGTMKNVLGEEQAAVDAMQHGVAVARQRVLVEGSNEAKQALALALVELGFVAVEANQHSLARTVCVEGSEILKKLASTPNYNNSVQLGLMFQAWMGEAQSLSAIHGTEEAKSLMEGKARMIEQLVEDLRVDGNRVIEFIECLLIDWEYGDEVPLNVGDVVESTETTQVRDESGDVDEGEVHADIQE